jgi:hypothetical protein
LRLIDLLVGTNNAGDVLCLFTVNLLVSYGYDKKAWLPWGKYFSCLPETFLNIFSGIT